MNNPPVPGPRSLSILIDQIRGAALTATINKERLSEVNRRLSGISTPPLPGSADAPIDRPPPLLTVLGESVDALLNAVESMGGELAIAEQTAEVFQPKPDMIADDPALGLPREGWSRAPGGDSKTLRMVYHVTPKKAAKPRAKKAPARRKAKR